MSELRWKSTQRHHADSIGKCVGARPWRHHVKVVELEIRQRDVHRASDLRCVRMLELEPETAFTRDEQVDQVRANKPAPTRNQVMLAR